MTISPCWACSISEQGKQSDSLILKLIFGNWTILSAFGACLLFGFARSGGTVLIQQLGLPSSYNDLVRILPYVLTLVLLIFFSRSNRSPRALGEPYEKGKR